MALYQRGCRHLAGEQSEALYAPALPASLISTCPVSKLNDCVTFTNIVAVTAHKAATFITIERPRKFIENAGRRFLSEADHLHMNRYRHRRADRCFASNKATCLM